MFFDAHIHNKGKEKGGFIIGLNGEPIFDNVLSSKDAISLHNPDKNYFSFYYISNFEKKKNINYKYLKYHPRREKYTVKDVINSIYKNNPQCVIIDTLNEPFWTSYDYWYISRLFPSVIFIFCHAGGYLINEFIKICHFQKNVWLDFSLTHTVIGKYGKGLTYINDAIKYSLGSCFSDKILLSSDFPFFKQDDVLSFYKDEIDLLNLNFITLIERLK